MDVSMQAEEAANRPLRWHKVQWQVHYEHAICTTGNGCEM